MKTVAAFSALVATTFAQNYFGVMSARSASPIHLLPLTTSGGKFWLGGETASYCPPNVGEVCTNVPGNTTVLAGGQGTLGMAVIVPGGQGVYIAPDGTMSHTTAHSAYVPEGSVRDGWTKTEGASYGTLSFVGGLVACPVEGKPYQVYGQLDNVTLPTGCLGFDSLTFNVSQPGAWQYA